MAGQEDREWERSWVTKSQIAQQGRWSPPKWLDMLRELVPWGRTHRLAVIVAGMLQYASAVAAEDKDVDTEGSVAWRLVAATETSDPEEVGELVLDLLQQLFDDAGVKSARSSAKGMPYSIVEDVIEEYVRWEDMPWE